MEYTGISLYEGVAIGKACLYQKEKAIVTKHEISDVALERERFSRAVKKAAEELSGLYEKVKAEVGESGAEIFMAHQMMLEDPEFTGAIDAAIEAQGLNADYAVTLVRDQYLAAFGALEDDYVKARIADILDVSERLIDELVGNSGALLQSEEPVILFAEDLTPSQTAQLPTDRILGFVTRGGSEHSHTAILAKTFGFPALAQCDFPEDIDGKRVIIDGETGALIIEPNKSQIEYYKKIEENEAGRQLELLSYKEKESITRDGKKIRLYANIGGAEDVMAALSNGAEGIGLFRTELLFLRAKMPPTEEEQYQEYRKVAEAMGQKPVIIRTLDIGADKQVPYLNLDKEENPAMGCRAIRLCFARPDLLKTQLRAIYRAAAVGNFSIMFPMVTSVDEVVRLKKLTTEVMAELDAEGITVPSLPIGIMIETPAAALISRDLAKEADFFSIGTNDLTQYTLAADRQNESAAAYYDPKHPAVEALIGMTIESAHEAGIWAGVCGELAGDEGYTKKLLAMGVDELSVAPSAVLKIREKIVS